MTKLSKALLAAGLSAALVGCGGGSETTSSTGEPSGPSPGPDSTPVVPRPMDVDLPSELSNLPERYRPTPGSFTITPGMTYSNNGVDFMCTTGGASCEVTVATDSVTSTGGTVTTGLTSGANSWYEADKYLMQANSLVNNIVNYSTNDEVTKAGDALRENLGNGERMCHNEGSNLGSP